MNQSGKSGDELEHFFLKKYGKSVEIKNALQVKNAALEVLYSDFKIIYDEIRIGENPL